MLEVNSIGLERAAYVRKEALKLLIIGPLYATFVLFLMYLSMYKILLSFTRLGYRLLYFLWQCFLYMHHY
jgi:ABC-type uncharacterized transport system permease subunit